MNEQQDCEDLGAALGDIPSVPPECRCEWCACIAASKERDYRPPLIVTPVDYDTPNVDESAK